MVLQQTGLHRMTLQQAVHMDYGPRFHRFAYRFCPSTIDLRIAPSQLSWSRSICHQSKGEKKTALLCFPKAAMIEKLKEYVQPEYAELAFRLPPTSGTFWSFLETQIQEIDVDDKHSSTCINEVVPFLARFFSTALVDKVIYNLALLQESFMGIEYTLREGKALFALNVLRDVEALCDVEGSPLHGFHGHVPGKVEGGYLTWDSSDDEGDAYIEERESSTLETGGAGAGSGMGGKSGDVEPFSILDDESIIVSLLPFAEPSFGDPNKVQAIKRRSGLFFLGAGAQEQIYNPHNSQSGKLPFFHGTMQSCLPDFKQRGINPPCRRNEFSRNTAFYVSNSLRQACEHPLHYHPAGNINDPICVLVFEVDIAVLHGLKPPHGSNSPLNCCWFPDTPEAKTAEWQEFCEGNYSERAQPHNFDIVIGPFCLPTRVGHWRKLRVEMPYNVPLTQVAFCSRRAREWLETSFKKAYMESFV